MYYNCHVSFIRFVSDGCQVSTLRKKFEVLDEDGLVIEQQLLFKFNHLFYFFEDWRINFLETSTTGHPNFHSRNELLLNSWINFL